MSSQHVEDQLFPHGAEISAFEARRFPQGAHGVCICFFEAQFYPAVLKRGSVWA